VTSRPDGTPALGDVIYLPSSLHLSHGADDLLGGRATVIEVLDGISLGGRVPFVRCAECPDETYNWHWLAPLQAHLAAEFGERKAHFRPDHHPQFNETTRS
jgi:hypothetical protein